MKIKTVVYYVAAFVLGGFLAYQGFSLYTYQYWVITTLAYTLVLTF